MISVKYKEPLISLFGQPLAVFGVPIITCFAVNKRAHCQPGDVLIDDMLKHERIAPAPTHWSTFKTASHY